MNSVELGLRSKFLSLTMEQVLNKKIGNEIDLSRLSNVPNSLFTDISLIESYLMDFFKELREFKKDIKDAELVGDK